MKILFKIGLKAFVNFSSLRIALFKSNAREKILENVEKMQFNDYI